MAQVAEHILGKDEVTGSNPVSSSIKSEILWFSKGFGLFVGINQKTPGYAGGVREL